MQYIKHLVKEKSNINKQEKISISIHVSFTYIHIFYRDAIEKKEVQHFE